LSRGQGVQGTGLQGRHQCLWRHGFRQELLLNLSLGVKP
jgi:hypothetical protein